MCVANELLWIRLQRQEDIDLRTRIAMREAAAVITGGEHL